MSALESLIYQLENSIKKIERSRNEHEISTDLAQCLTHLLHAARALAQEEKKKYPDGMEPKKEEGIVVTGMHMYPGVSDG